MAAAGGLTPAGAWLARPRRRRVPAMPRCSSPSAAGPTARCCAWAAVAAGRRVRAVTVDHGLPASPSLIAAARPWRPTWASRTALLPCPRGRDLRGRPACRPLRRPGSRGRAGGGHRHRAHRRRPGRDRAGQPAARGRGRRPLRHPGAPRSLVPAPAGAEPGGGAGGRRRAGPALRRRPGQRRPRPAAQPAPPRDAAAAGRAHRPRGARRPWPGPPPSWPPTTPPWNPQAALVPVQPSRGCRSPPGRRPGHPAGPGGGAGGAPGAAPAPRPLSRARPGCGRGAGRRPGPAGSRPGPSSGATSPTARARGSCCGRPRRGPSRRRWRSPCPERRGSGTGCWQPRARCRLPLPLPVGRRRALIDPAVASAGLVVRAAVARRPGRLPGRGTSRWPRPFGRPASPPRGGRVGRWSSRVAQSPGCRGLGSPPGRWAAVLPWCA